MQIRNQILAALMLLPCAMAQSQSAAPTQPTDFPANATILSADALRAQLVSGVYHAKLANGDTWRLEYKDNGYYFVNTGSGFNGSGTWSLVDGKLCGKLRSAPISCAEVRGEVQTKTLHIKRANGDIVALTQQ